MCWSAEASAAVAVAGIASGMYCWKRGDSYLIWLPVVYFAGMEVLQAFTYSVIDQCASETNQTLTLIAYVHISFQPIFINMFSLYFIPEDIRHKIQHWVLILSAMLGLLFLMRIFPLDFLKSCVGMTYNFLFCPSCRFPVPLCGEKLCAISGNWHIAWSMPLRFHPLLDNAYSAAVFLMPLLYGSWRVTLYLFIAGPLLASLTTDNPNEWPAVWCLFSTIILGIALQPRIRAWVRVDSFYGWNLKK